MMAQTQPYACAARVGARMKTFRESQGLTLRELARRTGFTHAQLSKVENGLINTPIETLGRIADALGIPLGMLVTDIDGSFSAEDNAMPHASMTYTVADLLTAYEKEYVPALADTTQYQQRRLFLWLRRELGYMLLTDLTPVFLRQWRDLLSTRYAPGTVRRYLTALSTPLTVAVKYYEWLSVNPLDKVKKPPEPRGRVRFLSDDERKALLLHCGLSRNPHVYTLVLLALSIGARKEQLRQLRWRDLDFTRGLVRVGVSKRTAPRMIPLLGPVRPLLERQRQGQAPDGWVFARHDGQQPLFCDHAFVTACRRAGIENMHFHDLRHSCASYLAMSGASLREIQEVLGHRNIATTAKYTHLTEGHTRRVLTDMADRFLAGALLASTLTMLASVWLVTA